MSTDEQRVHALGHLEMARDSFGSGPKWAFAVDTASENYVAYVDCDLANDHVPLDKQTSRTPHTLDFEEEDT